MAHTIEDKIIELADKYTLNHSNESYLNNKAMLDEFRKYIEKEMCGADVRKTCELVKKQAEYSLAKFLLGLHESARIEYLERIIMNFENRK